MAKTAAYYRSKKAATKKRRNAQRAAEELESSSTFSEGTIQRQLCYFLPLPVLGPGPYDSYDNYLQAQYEEFWMWYGYAPWYADPVVSTDSDSDAHAHAHSPSASRATPVKQDTASDFDPNRYFGPLPYQHENLKYMTKDWWEAVGDWVDRTQRGGDGCESERREIGRDEWDCDFCGAECFCWTVGL